MTQMELLPFLTLLATVGCMSWHQAVTSAASDVASTIDPGQSAQAKCEDFTCEP